MSPSLETVRDVIRACGLELTFFISRFDDSNVSIIDENLRMTPTQRFANLMARERFHEQLVLGHSNRYTREDSGIER